MRLLIVVPYGVNRSGLEIANVRLAIELERSGLQVEIIEKGASHTLYHHPVRGFHSLVEILNYLIDARNKYDVLHWGGLFENMQEIADQIRVSETLKDMHGKRVSFFVERTGEVEPFEDPAMYAHLRRFRPRLAVANPEQKRLLEQWLGGSGEVVVLPTGVDTRNEYFPPSTLEKRLLRKKLELENDCVIGIYTGRFVPRKQLDLMVEAWSHLRKELAHLVLVGSGFDDPLSNEKRIRTLAEACGNVKVVNYSDRLKRADYYRASDFAIFASMLEGEPTALVESMSCGLPVIASDISGHRELVIPEVTGLLFQAHSRQQLLNCINTMLRSDTMRSLWGSNARSAIVKQRDIKVIAARFRALIA